ncbi:MAG: copper amine oxidase N-terminal protein [Paenibacillus sp.]|jgi:hypothetical protein|nr:copper amine oxidase N-terminal protein [Paenibacillus sp.]
MKRIFALITIVVLSVALCVPVNAADNEPRAVAVEVDGGKLAAGAYMVDGRTMVPLRAIFERLNATVEWDDVTKSVTATKNTTTVWLAIGQTDAKIGDKPATLDVPPMLINGNTFVPLRFVSEALGAQVSFDGDTSTAKVTTGSSCVGGQTHSGTISPAGETWSLCGSPHFVKGDFRVEGKESPVLTIEAGAVVRFENGASISVGEQAPGGLVIAGTADKPAVLTADSAEPKPGFWQGIRFYELALRGNASIEGARIEYAGGWEGALVLDAAGQLLEVTLTNTELKNSLFAGIRMNGHSRLSERSANVTISGTKSSQDGGGFPIVTDLTGSHKLPQGNYAGNDVDAVRVTALNTYEEMVVSTTWRNIGISYESDVMIAIEGPSAPVLTIEPGVVTRWAKDTGLIIGENGKGGLMAAGTKEKPIVFTGEMEKPGAWLGITFSNYVAAKNILLQYATIEFADIGLYFYDDIGPVVKNSTIRGNKQYGVYMPSYETGQTDYRKGLGNTFKDNGTDQSME